MYLSTLMLFVRQTPPENLEEREAAEELGGWKNKDTSPARLIWYWSQFFLSFEILSQDLTRIVETTRCGRSLQCFVGRGQQRQRRQHKLFKQADVGEPSGWSPPSLQRFWSRSSSACWLAAEKLGTWYDLSILSLCFTSITITIIHLSMLLLVLPLVILFNITSFIVIIIHLSIFSFRFPTPTIMSINQPCNQQEWNTHRCFFTMALSVNRWKRADADGVKPLERGLGGSRGGSSCSDRQPAHLHSTLNSLPPPFPPSPLPL